MRLAKHRRIRIDLARAAEVAAQGAHAVAASKVAVVARVLEGEQEERVPPVAVVVGVAVRVVAVAMEEGEGEGV